MRQTSAFFSAADSIKNLAFYMAITLFSVPLSAETLTILRGNENYPPDEIIVDGKLTGFHIELLQQVAKQIEIPIRFESVPWARALRMIRYGEADAISYISETPERAQYALFLPDNAISHTEHYLLSHREHNKPVDFSGDLQQLQGKVIGVQRGYSYGPLFDQSEDIEKLTINSVEQMVALLKGSRIDLAILSLAEYQQLKHTPAFSGLTHLPHPLSSRPNYIAFSKKRNLSDKARRFATGLKAFKQTREYRQLLHKYNKVITN